MVGKNTGDVMAIHLVASIEQIELDMTPMF